MLFSHDASCIHYNLLRISGHCWDLRFPELCKLNGYISPGAVPSSSVLNRLSVNGKELV